MLQATLTYTLMLAVMSVPHSSATQVLMLFFCVGPSTLDTSLLSLRDWVLERSCSEGGPRLPTIRSLDQQFYHSNFTC
jgi:hypothetical protein